MDYMLMGSENIITIFIAIIGFIIVLWAQMKIKSSYNKYKNIRNDNNLSGVEVARKILDANDLSEIYVVKVSGELTDHYDPKRKVIRLSKDIFDGTSIAAVSVAAHEVGHAIQDKEGYSFMRIRSFLVPVVNFVTYIGYFVSIVSIFAGITSYIKVGIFMILAALLFQLITLPVEFNASNRAKQQLKNLSLINDLEINEVEEMLLSAAMTYVASFISSILNLLRLIIMLKDDDK